MYFTILAEIDLFTFSVRFYPNYKPLAMQKILLGLLLLFMVLSGCGIRQREVELDNKAAELAKKEQELLLKEKTLQIKETELSERELSLDSTMSDTSSFNPQISGNWNAKMTCTEATCPGSAVGDTKTEVWQFSYLNQNLVVKAFANNNLVRVYTGGFKDGNIILNETVGATEQSPATQFKVRLTLNNNGALDGSREIERSGECKIVYSLVLTR